MVGVPSSERRPANTSEPMISGGGPLVDLGRSGVTTMADELVVAKHRLGVDSTTTPLFSDEVIEEVLDT